MLLKQVSIPLRGLASKEATPSELVGTLKKCRNWLHWKGMLRQPPGHATMVAATNLHSAIFYRDSNANPYIVYTDDRDIKSVTADNNLTGATITSSEFAANAGNKVWPIDRFDKHIFFGSDHDGLHFYYPPGYSGTYTGKIGVAAPANKATSIQGSNAGLTGVYQLVYTFVNARNHESAPSPASDPICVYDHDIEWSNIEAGPAGTTARKLYRTVNDGGLFLYLATIPDNTTTSYTDNTTDTSLGIEVDWEGSDVPPTVIRAMCVAGSRLYLLDNNSTIWACKIDSQTSLPNWEAYPSALSTKIPAGEGSDDVMTIFSLDEVVYAATRNRVFKLLGDPYTGTSVIKIADIGLMSRYAWTYVDSDRSSIYMLTSNYKVVKLNKDGGWTEVGEAIISLLQTMSNYKAPDLGDSAEMTHDSARSLLLLNCATTGQSNHTTFILDLKTGLWSQVDYGYMVSLISDTSQQLIGYKKGSAIVWQNDSTLFKLDSGNYFTDQQFETHPFQAAGKEMSIGRIGIVCKALPLSGVLPPMLKVEWAKDDNDVWKTKWVDVSNLGIKAGNNSITSRPMITSYVPVNSVVDSLSIRVTAPANVAAVQGFEIYDIFIEVEEAEDANPKTQHKPRDSR